VDHEWPAPGTYLAFRYRLVTLLETGGMAEIWRAQDELLARPVAVKLPTDRSTGSTRVAQLAWKEARTAARLSHPHIAAVHDFQEAVRPDGSVTPFVVMELLTGETLASRLSRSPMPWPEAARVAVAVADALAAAHANGVVHRDIKPGNVMLTPTGVKILDFGISADAGEPDDDETGATFGTPAYAAPERLDGKPAEPATDMYGLGVLLFEMVTGEPPYPVDTWEELAAARAAGPDRLPAQLPGTFRQVVERCLDEDPERRPTAVGVRDRLTALAPVTRTDAAAAPRPAPAFAAGRAPATTVTMPAPERHGRAIRVGVAVIAVALAATFVTIGASHRTDNAEPSPLATPLAAPSPSATPVATPSSSAPAVPVPLRVTSKPPAVKRPAPPLNRDDAVIRVRAAVEDGRAVGQIRPDAATDLLNLIKSLTSADDKDLDGLVDNLRRKIQDRVSEGTVAADRATVLQSRLTDLGRAVGT
jgi:eukaryotic-like serine/threonine-protein kinase